MEVGVADYSRQEPEVNSKTGGLNVYEIGNFLKPVFRLMDWYALKK
jgi:hypothetical protein